MEGGAKNPFMWFCKSHHSLYIWKVFHLGIPGSSKMYLWKCPQNLRSVWASATEPNRFKVWNWYKLDTPKHPFTDKTYLLHGPTTFQARCSLPIANLVSPILLVLNRVKSSTWVDWISGCALLVATLEDLWQKTESGVPSSYLLVGLMSCFCKTHIAHEGIVPYFIQVVCQSLTMLSREASQICTSGCFQESRLTWVLGIDRLA